MDRREAIRVIKELLADRDNDSRYPCVSSPRHYEALDLAIGALQEPITIRKVVLEPTNPETLLEQGMRSLDGLEAELFVKEKYQLSGETSTKLKNPDDSLLTEDSEACKEQKSKLDCISREQAIEAMAPFDTNHELRDTLDNLPPVIPTEHKTTETMIVDGVEMEIDPVSYEIGYSHGQTAPIEMTGEWIGLDECSVCGKQAYDFIEGFVEGIEYLPNYCPNCGADMRGDKE